MAIRKRTIAAGTAGVLAGAVALISPWEGYYGKTYRDIVGVPTVCYGETDRAAVEAGRHRTFTKPECMAMLQNRLPEYDRGFMRCVKRAIPDSVHIAGISLSYNVGVGAVCKSTFVRRINVGDYRGACEALLMFTKAGGQYRRGLDNRRHDERKVCLEGL